VRRRHVGPRWVATDLRHSRANAFPSHEHRWTCLTLLLGGQYGERTGSGGWEERRVNSLVLRPAHAPHADRIGTRGAWFLTLELAPELVAGRAERTGALTEWRVADHPRMVALAWRIQAGLFRADSDLLDGYVEALLAELGAAADFARTREPPGWLRLILARLHDLPLETISLDVLAADCGVHPAHLTRVFRLHTGHTIGGYRRALRLSLAMQRLGDGVPPAAAAGAAGFHDQSHLARTIRRATGLTPGRYSRAAREQTQRGDGPFTSG
jgi:AraC family transcriptional regulator